MERIVVGIDGSPGSRDALRWAFREHLVRGWPLTAVMAWGYLDQHQPPSGEPFAPDYDASQARSTLEAFVIDALGDDAAASVERRAPCDLARHALTAEADDAALLVVGARGLGGFRGLLLGSVSQQCLQHARCPVAVVRASGDAPTVEPDGAVGRIVVGVDGSENSGHALRWAYDEARARGAPVDVVHAWSSVPYADARFGGSAESSWDWLEDAGRAVLDAAVDAEPADGLVDPPRRVLVPGSAAGALVHAGEEADLIVVGARGLGAIRALILGSVSQQVVQHATVPVVVVPTPA
jgi:nucleotide-binding universal stress UspA family protein